MIKKLKQGSVKIARSHEERLLNLVHKDFPGGSDDKASVYNAGDPGSIPGSGRSSGEGNDNPIQYSSLKIPWTEELGGLGSQRVRHN